MVRILISLLIALLTVGTASAQRYTDKLDRGLIGMKVSGGIYLSWRIQADEYYDVTYNVYRDGERVAENLKVSNFTDSSGTINSTYKVAAVVRGEEQTLSKEQKPWTTSYKEIQLKHEDIKSTLVPNDACCADVDGDGELEILMKFDNQSEIEQSYPKNGPVIGGTATKEYSIMECLKLDGTRLWWINCGPNMGDFQNNEQNIVAYDWDQDGKAEVVMRACDGTTIHLADGSTYTVGDPSVNVRPATGGGTNWFVITTGEYLLYLDGETGKVHQCLPYPLPLLESGETDVNKAWGDGYGHRASKHFFGAPYLDGKKPSIFLARGIYTRHKMIAYDVNPQTHTLKERWRWFNNTDGPWKGQGYHNYCVADVDLDGRDEIVFGSMVIDDNGKGLSTTGFGHGDAEHVGDLNPYHHGLEVFACMEDNPGTNYRDATTSKVFFRYTAERDVGRCMAGNFSNKYPGGICTPTGGKPLSTVTAAINNNLVEDGISQNFRIYWDGDLCEETFNYVNGKNTEGCITRYGSWTPIYTCAGSMTNNDTKGTPCYQGDILGDWREEIIMRTANNNIRIYSTPTSTKWRIPSLWYDHQYRNAMVWQMCGYNQPPRPSYFLGELEGITVAPPPLTMTGRVNVPNEGTIGSSLNGQHAIVCETQNSNVTIEAGVAPEVLTFNVPTTYTCSVSGAGISGNARLVKQGDGILTLSKADFTHSGNTDIWGGTLNFDGTMKQSPLWLNRHTELNSDGGEYKSIKADYASVIRPGGANHQGTIITDTLSLGFGSRLSIDLFSKDTQADVIKAKVVKLECKTSSVWKQYGPEYLAPVIELTGHLAEGEQLLTPGKYVIAEISELEGDVADLIIEGLNTQKKKVYTQDGKLIVEIIGLRDAANVIWTGANGNAWDDAETLNFSLKGDDTPFVAGDSVVFADEAQLKSVSIKASVYPASVTVDNTESYTFSGNGSISGDAVFTKQNTGTVTMNVANSYSGGNHLKGGTVKVTTLSNQYSATGNLGSLTTKADLFTMEEGAALQATKAIETGSPMKMVGEKGGVINAAADFKMNAALSGTLLTKKGNGCLYLMQTGTLERLVMAGGDVAIQNNTPVKSIEIQTGTLYDGVQATSHALTIPKGKSATWQLTGVYYTAYANKLTGEGTLTIIPRNTVQRVRITGDWSQFAGTVKHTTKTICLPFDNSSGMPNATLDVAEGCSVSNVCKSFAIGRLTGKGSLLQPIADFKSQAAVSGNNTWNVGNSWETGGDFTFEGTFKDEGGSNKCLFNKVGTCKMTVSGKSTHSGATHIKGGELCLKSGATLGTGTLSVDKNATLSGVTASSGLTNSSYSIANGGTLRVGSSSTATTGVMRFGGKSVSFASGSVLELGVAQAASINSTGGTSIQHISKLTMNGTIRLYYAPTAAENLSVGDSIILWKDVASFEGTPLLENNIIDAEKCLVWDVADLNKGILRVAYDNTLNICNSIKENKSKKQSVYTLDGQRISNIRKGQINIVSGQKIYQLP